MSNRCNNLFVSASDSQVKLIENVQIFITTMQYDYIQCSISKLFLLPFLSFFFFSLLHCLYLFITCFAIIVTSQATIAPMMTTMMMIADVPRNWLRGRSSAALFLVRK